MRRTILLLLGLAVLPACLCGLPNMALRPGPPTEQTAAAQPAAATEPAALADAPPSTPTVVRLHRSGGSLTEQLRAEVRKAAALGQRPFVEFDADW